MLELVRSIFIPVDATAILRIPVQPQEDDWWAWDLEKYGEYSVKSAYRKLVDMKRNADGMLPGGSGDESWKRTWNLQVPPKVKVFWWRVLHEFIPAKEILNGRHIEPVAFCDSFGADPESILHVLANCTLAKMF